MWYWSETLIFVFVFVFVTVTVSVSVGVGFLLSELFGSFFRDPHRKLESAFHSALLKRKRTGHSSGFWFWLCFCFYLVFDVCCLLLFLFLFPFLFDISPLFSWLVAVVVVVFGTCLLFLLFIICYLFLFLPLLDHPRDHPDRYLYYARTFWLYRSSKSLQIVQRGSQDQP